MAADAAFGSLLLQHTLLQQFNKIRLRHRAREKEALPDVAAHLIHGQQVSGTFQPFGNRQRTEIMRQINDRSADAGIARIVFRMDDSVGCKDAIASFDRARPAGAPWILK